MDTSFAEGTRLLTIVAITLSLALFLSPNIGFRTDAYDHIGAIRHMTERGDTWPGEYFHPDRLDNLDPRKGSNHTALAMVSLLTGEDPLDTWTPFWVFHLLILLLAFFRFAEVTLGGRGGAWIALALLLLLFRGGPSGEWFRTMAYPGKSGLILHYLLIAFAIESPGRKSRGKWLVCGAILGAGLAGVHIFFALLSGLALLVLLAAILLSPSARGLAGEKLRYALAVSAGCFPLLLFRYLRTYDPANPVHLHRQGALILPGNLAVIDPIALAGIIGLAGGVAFILLPFLFDKGRPATTGTLYLAAALLAVFLIVLNPVLYPILERKGGYLLRRIPLLAPIPVVLAALIRRGWAGRKRWRAALPGGAALIAVLITFHTSCVYARSMRELPFHSGEENLPWIGPLVELTGKIPAGSTVLTDPVTAYTLYGMNRLHITAVIDQHSSPNDPDGAARIADTQRFFLRDPGDGGMDRIVERYGVDYVLINHLFRIDFRTYNTFIDAESYREAKERLDRRPDRFLPVTAPRGLSLYKVVGKPVIGADDPPVRQPFLDGPDPYAPLPGGLRLRGGRIGTNEAAPDEIVSITTLWELEQDEPEAMPALLFIRGRKEGDPGNERISWKRKPEKMEWQKVPLGGHADPYTIWQKGDRITDRHRFRVPAVTPPGRYRIEVTIDPTPFFAVRRLQGLERGAIRTGWTVIDTLEVRP